ncbi:MAG TPA: TonB family protein [Verrucomicrobiae bacterium]|nr:TonB family protein [Verrucomicrobiae bacterium]
MSTADTRFRRNFVVASVLHVVLIGGLIGWESFFADSSRSALASVELVTPADLFGELPKGTGHGRGAYAPPKPTPGADAVAGPSEAMMSADESPAPRPKAPSSPKSDPNEIAIPRKAAPKKPSPTKSVPNTGELTRKSTTTAKKTTATSKSAVASGSSTASAQDIRNRFAKALTSAEDGTPYGDGKTAGGGTATGGRIGSPTGSPDGVVGGVGQGSPNWQYYEHVHDLMYEAWEQPGQLLDKKLVAVVLIRVARDGSITDVELKSSSGNKLMDDSAIAAVRKVQRLDPPPDALVKDSTANITVNFQVEG